MVSRTVKPQLKRSLFLALFFQVAWLAAMLIALSFHYPVQIGLVIAMIPVLWIPAVVELVTRTNFPDALQIHFYAFITAASIGGSAFGLYALIPHWDTWVHVDSGVMLGWLGLFMIQQVENKINKNLPHWFAMVTAVMTSMAFAALWEISEFLSDTYLHTTTQANLEDSIIDMIAALVGALIAVGLAWWLRWPRSVLPRTHL